MSVWNGYPAALIDRNSIQARIAYAANGILLRYAQRDTDVGEDRNFDCCFEMGDGAEVAKALLERGLTDAAFRKALAAVMSLPRWLALCPEFKKRYDAIDPRYALEDAR